ncbi:MAG: DUF6485 family protein [Candidatus Thermoplasmatota archaeon]
MLKECPNQEYNRKHCICTYEPCDKKGMCCECIRYHLKRHELPGCAFSKEVEKTYDRSFEKFAAAYK